TRPSVCGAYLHGHGQYVTRGHRCHRPPTVTSGTEHSGLRQPGKRKSLTPHLAMIRKHLLRPERLRRIPPSFSWVDHRLVRDHYLPRADHSAWALYLFLLTVADVQGLSFYSDRAIGRHLKMDSLQL